MSQLPTTSAPKAVQSLEYHTPSDTPRPGSLMVLGVFSIILGSLGVLSGLLGMAAGTMNGLFQPRVVYRATPMPVTRQPTIARLSPAAQQQAVRALTQRAPLSKARQEMLDQLVGSAGGQMFGIHESTFTDALLADSVLHLGQMPATGDEPATDFLVLRYGRIELNDNDANFAARDGTTTFVNRNRSDATVRPPPPPAPSPRPTRGAVIAPPQYSRLLPISIAATNFGLAVLLLIGGLRVVQGRTRQRKLHLIYAFIKIPEALIAGLGIAFLFNVALGPVGGSVLAWLVGLFTTVVGCIYPIVILLVLNLRSVRIYHGKTFRAGVIRHGAFAGLDAENVENSSYV